MCVNFQYIKVGKNYFLTDLHYVKICVKRVGFKKHKKRFAFLKPTNLAQILS